MATSEPKTPCRTPAKGRDGVVNIPSWKFELLTSHITAILTDESENGVAFGDLRNLVDARLDDAARTKLGSVGWHVTTVKLELEVAGVIERIPNVSPQRVRLVTA